jgi:NAD(P)-dependent dehydrogenase (short-subunit alcohol dehydrogenase family)
MSRLAGKVALITGRLGIGMALPNGLAAAKASVAVPYASDRSSAEAVVTAITASGADGARLLFPRRKTGTKRRSNSRLQFFIFFEQQIVSHLSLDLFCGLRQWLWRPLVSLDPKSSERRSDRRPQY